MYDDGDDDDRYDADVEDVGDRGGSGVGEDGGVDGGVGASICFIILFV